MSFWGDEEKKSHFHFSHNKIRSSWLPRLLIYCFIRRFFFGRELKKIGHQRKRRRNWSSTLFHSSSCCFQSNSVTVLGLRRNLSAGWLPSSYQGCQVYKNKGPKLAIFCFKKGLIIINERWSNIVQILEFHKFCLEFVKKNPIKKVVMSYTIKKGPITLFLAIANEKAKPNGNHVS